MSRSNVFAAATAAVFGALLLGAIPAAYADGLKEEGLKDDAGTEARMAGDDVYYYVDRRKVIEFPSEGYPGYRPFYGRYYGRPDGAFRPAGISYRPHSAARSPEYCRTWGFTYKKNLKIKGWECMAW